MLKNGRGFTLVELLVTGAILAVLAGLALPNYFSSLEAGRLSEAKTNLQIIYTGEKVYALNNAGNFKLPSPNPPTNAAQVNTDLTVDIATKFYDLDVFTVDNTATPKTFTSKVKRNATSGGDTTKTFKIDQDGVIKDKNNAVVT